MCLSVHFQPEFCPGPHARAIKSWQHETRAAALSYMWPVSCSKRLLTQLGSVAMVLFPLLTAFAAKDGAKCLRDAAPRVGEGEAEVPKHGHDQS